MAARSVQTICLNVGKQGTPTNENARKIVNFVKNNYNLLKINGITIKILKMDTDENKVLRDKLIAKGIKKLPLLSVEGEPYYIGMTAIMNYYQRLMYKISRRAAAHEYDDYEDDTERYIRQGLDTEGHQREGKQYQIQEDEDSMDSKAMTQRFQKSMADLDSRRRVPISGQPQEHMERGQGYGNSRRVMDQHKKYNPERPVPTNENSERRDNVFDKDIDDFIGQIDTSRKFVNEDKNDGFLFEQGDKADDDLLLKKLENM